MKKLLTSIAWGTTIVLAVSAGTATAAMATTSPAPQTQQVVQSGYSTEQMLDGIVFNRGVVAADLDIVVALPENMTAADVTEYDDVVSTLRTSMLTRDADALAVAAEQMTSGDPYQVETALAAYRTSFEAAMDAEYPGVREDHQIITPMCGLIAVCGAVSVAAIALGAAIAVVTFNVAGGVNIIYLENGLWDGNSFTGARSAPTDESGSEKPQGLSATDTVRFLATNLAGK
ncbi:hypothetical protein [Microbacterium testaceum]|uniref:hypothetical protein n=1 Tax=Microbacterium testaceum TaxID=2033 RepID=UPI000733DF68|nr:hypothetical protein [Microbacterium testaceum]KTS05292.1 hypothetical protein NS283_06460 [Microbacterium testaceum]